MLFNEKANNWNKKFVRAFSLNEFYREILKKSHNRLSYIAVVKAIIMTTTQEASRYVTFDQAEQMVLSGSIRAFKWEVV